MVFVVLPHVILLPHALSRMLLSLILISNLSVNPQRSLPPKAAEALAVIPPGHSHAAVLPCAVKSLVPQVRRCAASRRQTFTSRCNALRFRRWYLSG
jgi:hypothetical protein